MPVHFEIDYSDSGVGSECVLHNDSTPLTLETSHPDAFEHENNSVMEEVDTITVIFSKDGSGAYPRTVSMACYTSTHVYVASPTGPSSPSSSVTVIRHSGEICEIKVTPTDDSSVEEWTFENSYCVDASGQPTGCPAGGSPTQLKVKVKRQASFSCPA
jgi:hypothetical protein